MLVVLNGSGNKEELKIPVVVGQILSTVTKVPLKFTADAPPQLVASIQMGSQILQAICSLQMMGYIPIPVIPWGSIIDYALTLIEALFNYFRTIIARIRKQMLVTYTIAMKLAQLRRSAAETKLYTDLKKAQQILIVKWKADKAQYKLYQVRYPKIKIEYEREMAIYMRTIQGFALKANEAKTAGDVVSENYWIDQIAAQDTWLAEIILKLVEQITIRIDMIFLDMTIKEEEPLCLIQIQKIWLKMAWEWSSVFNVAVPYYPDLPDYPNLPPMPPIFRIPQIVKCTLKGMAKWLCAPQLPPLGVFLDALLHCLMNMIPINIPPLAAYIESQGDAFIEYLGFCI